MRGERGFALVITLIVTALLTALLVEFVNEVYVDTSHSHNFVASQQAEMLAESGVTGGIKLLKYDLMTHQGYSSLLDLWAAPQSYDAGVGKVTVTIEEESGKMNINTATSSNGTPNDNTAMARRLFEKAGVSPNLVDVVMDWVDENDNQSQSGAETTYYTTLKPPYKAKNARLDTVEELALLKGFTPDVVTRLKPLITVYGQASSVEPTTPININTAPKELIDALSDKMSTSMVNDILEYRKTKAIKALNDIPSVRDAALSSELTGKVSVVGYVYRIHSEAKVGETTSIVEAVIRLSGTNHTVLYWREY